MGTLGSLAVSIIGDSQLDKVFDETRKKTQDFGKNIQDMGKKVGNTGKGLSKFVTGPALGFATAAGGLILKTSQWADELLDLSEATGMSTDTLQEWREVANKAGTDQDAVARGTDRLRRQYTQLEKGQGTAAEGFKKLGLDVRDTGGEMKDMETLVDDAIHELAGMEDITERNAYAQRIFGGATKDILPILGMTQEELAKTREGANVVDEDQLNALDKFREMWDTLKKQFADTGREIAANLLPIVQDTLMPFIQNTVLPFLERLGDRIGILIKWFADLNPTIQKVIGVVAGLAVALGPVLMVLGPIITAVGAVIAALSAKVVIIGLVVAAIASFIGWIVSAWQSNDELREKLLAAWENIKETGLELWGSVKDALEEIWKALQETFEHVLNWMQDFWEKWGDTIFSIGEKVWDQIVLVVDTAINVIKDIIHLVLGVIRGDWEEAWGRIRSIGETIWNLIKGTIENVFGGIKAFLGGVWDWIRDRIVDRVKDIYERVKKWFKSLQESITDVWTGIKDGIRGTVNDIIGHVESMVNWSVRQINRFIRNINRAIGIINRIPGVNLGNIPTMNEINIPRLHTGTRYFRPPDGAREGLALLERGEKVIPRRDAEKEEKVTYITNKFEIAEMNVRDDRDIEMVAKELHELQKKRGRSV